MLTCRELTELVTNRLEGHLSLTERLTFEMHLAMCRHCRAYVQQMRETVHTLGKLAEKRVSQEACAHLVDRFRNWKQQ